jgi:hypothetical protein
MHMQCWGLIAEKSTLQKTCKSQQNGFDCSGARTPRIIHWMQTGAHTHRQLDAIASMIRYNTAPLPAMSSACCHSPAHVAHVCFPSAVCTLKGLTSTFHSQQSDSLPVMRSPPACPPCAIAGSMWDGKVPAWVKAAIMGCKLGVKGS